MQTPEERKKKMLLFLPLLLLPFLALAFYAMSGGKGANVGDSPQTAAGINTSLPGAKLQKQKTLNKMGLYDQAERDSALAKSHTAGNAFAALGWNTAGVGKKPFGINPSNSAQASEAKINQKLAEINRQISAPEPVKGYGNGYQSPVNTPSPDMDRLEKLLKQKSQANAPDPEMQQLNSMLEKIEDIQHPEQAAEKLKKQVKAKPDSLFKAIPALVDGNQKVLQGGIVKLRLPDSITLKGFHLPKGFPLFGNCMITNQRLLLTIKNITLGNTIIPVDLTVFSRDGIPGINAPEAELGEAAGNGTNDALESMEFLPMDQSLSIQAASAGINAAKGLIGRKVKKIKVKLQNNYPVLLRNNH
jgi:hypothetical protein